MFHEFEMLRAACNERQDLSASARQEVFAQWRYEDDTDKTSRNPSEQTQRKTDLPLPSQNTDGITALEVDNDNRLIMSFDPDRRSDRLERRVSGTKWSGSKLEQNFFLDRQDGMRATETVNKSDGNGHHRQYYTPNKINDGLIYSGVEKDELGELTSREFNPSLNSLHVKLDRSISEKSGEYLQEIKYAGNPIHMSSELHYSFNNDTSGFHKINFEDGTGTIRRWGDENTYIVSFDDFLAQRAERLKSPMDGANSIRESFFAPRNHITASNKFIEILPNLGNEHEVPPEQTSKSTEESQSSSQPPSNNVRAQLYEGFERVKPPGFFAEPGQPMPMIKFDFHSDKD